LKRTSTTICGLLLLAFLACAGLAAGQPPFSTTPAASTPPSGGAIASAPRAPDSQTSDNDFRKGAFYWRFAGGGSLPIDYNDSSSERNIWIMALEVGRIMTRRVGPGPLAGQLQYVFQGQPTIVRGPDHFGGMGFTPILLRWNFAGGKQIRPMFEAGAGLMYIYWPDPKPNQLALNFYEQVGFGARIGRPSKTGLVVGFKYQHISNGGRAKPATGTDAYILYGGVDFLQKSVKPGEAGQGGGASAPGAPTPSEPKWPAQGLSFGGGTGLIRAVTPDTLEPGNFAASVMEMNYDRNPGDVDVMKFGFQFAIGVTKRIEAFVDYVPVARTNAVNLDPLAYPVPPLDLIVDTYPTVASRTEPYFLFPPEFPYKTYDVPTVRVIPPSWGAFSSSSGDLTVGGKVSLLSERRGNPLGLGVHGYAVIPTEKPEGNTANWATLNGVPGGIDVGVQLAVEKVVKKVQIVGNVGYRFVGAPDLGGMRIQYVDSSRAGTPGFIVGQSKTVALELHDQLSFAGGARMPIIKLGTAQLWALGELSHVQLVGSATQVERVINVTEFRLGIQGEVPGYHNLLIGAAWQAPLTDMGNGDTRVTNFKTPDGRGDINFGQFVDPALASTVGAYFAQNGVTLGTNTSKVFATNNAAFDTWRNVKTSAQPVVAAGNYAVVAFITWRFR
jgi:hypothetical protein